MQARQEKQFPYTRIAGTLLCLEESQMTEQSSAAPDPEEMETVYLGLLRRGDAWTPEVTQEVMDLQEAHLANIRRLAETGKLIAAGPLTDDDDIRGVYIFRVDSMEEALELTQTDPAVQAGRLAIDLHPWWVARDTFTR